VSMFRLTGMPFTFTLFFDLLSLSFSFVILLIRAVVMIYAYNYMAHYSKPTYFIWLTFLFVLSMLFVGFFSNIFFLLLG